MSQRTDLQVRFHPLILEQDVLVSKHPDGFPAGNIGVGCA